MNALWSLEFTIFSLMAVGFLIAKLHVVGKEAERVITDMVMDLILPCNIFCSFLGDHSGVGMADFVWILGISLGIQMLAVLYAKFAFKKESADRRCNIGFGMICSNAGFLGNAVTEGTFGPVGLMLNSIFLIPQRIMMWSEGLALYSGVSDKKQTIKKVVTHPCVIACFLGLLFMLANWSLPELILNPIRSISKCNTPLTMMMVGMLLANVDFRDFVDKTIARFAFDRLVVMPLVVYLILLVLPVTPIVRGVSVILSAMPAGATTSMLAIKYNRDPMFASKLVAFTTLCSIPAIFIWSMILVV